MKTELEKTIERTNNSIDYQNAIQEYKAAKEDPNISKDELKLMKLNLKKFAKLYRKEKFLAVFNLFPEDEKDA